MMPLETWGWWSGLVASRCTCMAMIITIFEPPPFIPHPNYVVDVLLIAVVILSNCSFFYHLSSRGYPFASGL